MVSQVGPRDDGRGAHAGAGRVAERERKTAPAITGRPIHRVTVITSAGITERDDVCDTAWPTP